MAAFVDCTKYTSEQNAQDQALENLAKKNEEQDKDIKALEDRKIVHDSTLTGGGIKAEDPLSVAVSTKPGNAVKTGKDADGNGVFVKDLQPEVDALEKALTDMNSRLSGDLTNSIKDLNNRLNNLKAIEVALAQAKADGNYQRIKDLEAQLAAAKQAEDLANKNLADAIDALRQQGLTDDQIRQIIADSIAKAGGTGRYVTGITVNQATGDVTYTYSDGTKVTGKLHDFQGVVVDNKTIGGNGTSEALHVKLSKSSGNLIRQNEDGLYMGQAATRPILYVDALNGDDSNVGTREKPLKTLRYALSTGLAGESQTIYIMEGQEHILDANAGVVGILNRRVYINPYGPFKDSKGPQVAWNGFLINDAYVRQSGVEPIIVFKGVKPTYYNAVGDTYDRAVFTSLSVSESVLEFSGVRLRNDLGFTFNYKSPDHNGVYKDYATNTQRIATSVNTVITIYNCNVDTVVHQQSTVLRMMEARLRSSNSY